MNAPDGAYPATPDAACPVPDAPPILGIGPGANGSAAPPVGTGLGIAPVTRHPGLPTTTPPEAGVPPRPAGRAWALPKPSALTWGALALAVVSRVGLAAISWLSLRVLPRLGPYPAQLPDDFFPGHPALDGWARWDTAHYVAVAGLGYGAAESPSAHGGVGFFPLYPLLMRGAVALVGVEPSPGALALAGIVVANLCFLLAVPLLAHLTAARLGADAGRTAALLLCVAPLGFFFNAAYSESLFLLLVLGCFAIAGQGRWWGAAALAGLASGTRLVGLALLPALALLAYRRGARLRDLAGIGLLSPAGLLAYFAYLAVRVDDPLAYFAAQATWGGWDEHVRFYAELFLTRPGDALGGDPRHLVILLNLGIAAFSLALLPRVWRTLDPGIALFTTLLVVVQTAATWVSLGRYLLPAVGIWMVAGALFARPPIHGAAPPSGPAGDGSTLASADAPAPAWAGWARDAIIITSALLLGLLTVLFAHGFWLV